MVWSFWGRYRNKEGGGRRKIKIGIKKEKKEHTQKRGVESKEEGRKTFNLEESGTLYEKVGRSITEGKDGEGTFPELQNRRGKNRGPKERSLAPCKVLGGGGCAQL